MRATDEAAAKLMNAVIVAGDDGRERRIDCDDVVLTGRFTPESVLALCGHLRDECLNEHLFATLCHARRLIVAWRDEDNHHRPHSSLGGFAPRETLKQSQEDRTLNRANQ